MKVDFGEIIELYGDNHREQKYRIQKRRKVLDVAMGLRLPADILQAIDRLSKKRGRSRFIRDALVNELSRHEVVIREGEED